MSVEADLSQDADLSQSYISVVQNTKTYKLPRYLYFRVVVNRLLSSTAREKKFRQ